VDVSDEESFVTDKRFSVGSWDWDVSRDHATWSDGMFEIYGLPRMPGHTLDIALQRLHEDARLAMAAKVRQALSTASPTPPHIASFARTARSVGCTPPAAFARGRASRNGCGA
jgi:hypothetical protein